MKTKLTGLIVAATATLAACAGASSDAALEEQARLATASALKVDPVIAAIEVSVVERGATSSSWSAHYEGKILNCSGTEQFKLPDCRVLQDTAEN